MKKRAKPKTFLKELSGLVRALKEMKPDETHILNIDANYGHYQLVIGPHMKGASRNGDRPIEIDGEIHHLFVTPDEIRAYPSKNQVMENLKDTVIMRRLHVHLMDPTGDGEQLDSSPGEENMLEAKEYINLAGKDGERIIERFEKNNAVSQDTYRIIQQDIIKALKSKRRKRVEEVA